MLIVFVLILVLESWLEITLLLYGLEYNRNIIMVVAKIESNKIIIFFIDTPYIRSTYFMNKLYTQNVYMSILNTYIGYNENGDSIEYRPYKRDKRR